VLTNLRELAAHRGERQQKCGANREFPPGDFYRGDSAESDLDQQIWQAPDEAQSRESEPSASAHFLVP
jgi:hypothetical protein